MSQENVEAFTRGFDGFNRGDSEALLDSLDPEVEWHPVFQVVMLGGEATVYRGHKGIRAMLRAWSEIFAEIDIEISEIRDYGERIAATGRIRARGQESGAEVESPAGWVVDFNNGKAVRMREYLDPKQALEAAGLRE
jgi:ketosteroid isomerase-like protein